MDIPPERRRGGSILYLIDSKVKASSPLQGGKKAFINPAEGRVL